MFAVFIITINNDKHSGKAGTQLRHPPLNPMLLL